MNATATKSKTEKGHNGLYVTYKGISPEFGEISKMVAYQATADLVAPDNDDWAPSVRSMIRGYSVKENIPEEITIPSTAEQLIKGGWRPSQSQLPEYRQNPTTLAEEAREFFRR